MREISYLTNEAVLRTEFSGRVLARQVQGPEFSP